MPFQAKDLIPVANIATFGLIMVTAYESPIRSLKDVVTMEKATPGKLNMASPGSGSSNHLTLEKFNAVAGTKLVHVPYKGGGPAIAGVVGDQVELTLISGAAAKPLLEGNKVRAIAVTSLDRVSLLPDVPTIAEQGFPGFESIAGQGLFVPAGTPPAIVKRINAEVMRILLEPRDADEVQGDGHPDQRPDARAVRCMARGGDRPVVGAHQVGGDQGRLNDAAMRDSSGLPSACGADRNCGRRGTSVGER